MSINPQTLAQTLDELEWEGLLRQTRVVDAIDGARIQIDGKWLVNFCSNDYLGLAQDKRVLREGAKAAEEFGWGSGSAPLLSGYSKLHATIEEEIAAFKGHEAAIVFPSGFGANVGVLPALVGEKDTVILDRLCHASLIDGARLSSGKLQVYPHKNVEELKRILEHSTDFAGRWIVTDGLFSMDGDLAPLPELLEVATFYEAGLIVDDAHGTGVLGRSGRGIEEELDCLGKCDVVLGTFSKALGSLGGFATGKKVVVDYLRNRARSFIFSTASPPSVIAAARASLHIIQSEPNRIGTLRQRSKSVRAKLANLGVRIEDGETPIIPIVIGSTQDSVQASNAMWASGFFLSAIRPPTVPKDSARLRLSITLLHKTSHLDDVARALASVLRPSVMSTAGAR